MPRSLFFAQGVDRAPVRPQIVREGRDVPTQGGEAIPVLGDDLALRHGNVTLAVALGIAVTELAIRDVLTNGRLGILGPKRGEGQ